MESQGEASQDTVRFGSHGQARFGTARRGSDWQGLGRQSRQGSLRMVMIWRGSLGTASHGAVRTGKAVMEPIG